MFKKEKISIDCVFIGEYEGHPSIAATIYTVVDMLDLRNIGILEKVLDSSEIITAKKIDAKSPPRRKADRFTDVLTDLVKNRTHSGVYDSILINSTSGGKFPFWTLMDLQGTGRVGPPDKRDWGYSCLSFIYECEKYDEEVLCKFKNLFARVCVAVNAFYGKVYEHSFSVQRDHFMALTADHPLDRKTIPDFDREIQDIYWLNYFGPGYVNHWEKNKVEALAIEYEVIHLENDGICVQTTREPVIADKSMRKITDYPFKKHFYEILGYNTFMHEYHQPGVLGEYVPTLEYHRSLLDVICREFTI